MERETGINNAFAASGGSGLEGCVLVVGRGPAGERPMQTQMRRAGAVCEYAENVAAARDSMSERGYQMVVVAVDGETSWLEFVRDVASADSGPVVVCASARPSMEQAVEAMRAGAVDLVGVDLPAEQLRGRLDEAMRRWSERQRSAQKARRLEKACEELSSTRNDIAGQVGSLCEDLVDAYGELTDRVEMISALSEYNCEIKQELDVEGLLRSTLEFFLSRTGPTNGAIYLPGAGGDYTLGAFVNLDMPRDSAEVVFDRLADFVPEYAEGLEHSGLLRGELDVERAFGADSGWLVGRTAIVASCEHEGECLAAVCLFRDETDPFDDSARELIGVLCSRFAEQLGKVIKVHHRHLPEGTWGFYDAADDEDDYGLAA